jgi:Ca2+-binding RTX toxin-like protein
MAATQRNGFKDGNGSGNGQGEGKGDLSATEFADHVMGTELAELMDGMAGDDVMIGFAGDDTVVGGLGKDNLSGGEGNDVLVGGAWTDASLDGIVDVGELTGDADEDHYDGGSSFADNGSDTIYGYQAEDVIDLTAALGTTLADLDLLDNGLADNSVDLVAGGYISYDAATGQLSVDTDGSAGLDDGLNVWFTVLSTVTDTSGDVPVDSLAGAAEIVVLVGEVSLVLPPVVI